MLVLRLMSGLVIALGIFFTAFGCVILRNVEHNDRLLIALRKELNRDMPIDSLRQIAIDHSTGYVVVGLILAISGIGLLFRRKWALWLFLALLASIFGLISFQGVRSSWYGTFDVINAVTTFALASIIGLFVWYFGRSKTRSHLI